VSRRAPCDVPTCSRTRSPARTVASRYRRRRPTRPSPPSLALPVAPRGDCCEYSSTVDTSNYALHLHCKQGDFEKIVMHETCTWFLLCPVTYLMKYAFSFTLHHGNSPPSAYSRGYYKKNKDAHMHGKRESASLYGGQEAKPPGRVDLRPMSNRLNFVIYPTNRIWTRLNFSTFPKWRDRTFLDVK